MICEVLLVIFDHFLGLQAPSEVRPAMQNTVVLCHGWPSAQDDPVVCILRKTEYWFSDGGLGSLRLSTKPLRQASLYSKISSGPGRLTKHTMEYTMSPRHSTVWWLAGGGWTRNRLGNTQMNWSTKSLDNPLSCLAFVQSSQSCEVVPCHVFQTPNGPWCQWVNVGGGHIKLD